MKPLLLHFPGSRLFLQLLAYAAGTLAALADCPGTNLVTVCDESGLRQALMIGGEVRFCCSGMITLTNKIDITKDVTLDASGQNVIINGNSTVRLFNVSTGVTFNVTNVSMINGRYVGTNGTDAGPALGQLAQPGESVGGAAVRNNGGTVRLVSCVLSNHSVAGGNGGNYSAQNTGLAGDGGSASGGAILNSGGSVYLFSSAFLTNSTAGGLAGASSPPPTNGTSLGGAVASLNGLLMVSNVFFSTTWRWDAWGFWVFRTLPAAGPSTWMERLLKLPIPCWFQTRHHRKPPRASSQLLSLAEV